MCAQKRRWQAPKTVRHKTQNVHHKMIISWCTYYFTSISLQQSNVEKLQVRGTAIHNKY